MNRSSYATNNAILKTLLIESVVTSGGGEIKDLFDERSDLYDFFDRCCGELPFWAI